MREKQSVLITGGNGFTGQYVTNIFEKNGYNVTATSLWPCTNHDYRIIDLRDEIGLKNLVQLIKIYLKMNATFALIFQSFTMKFLKILNSDLVFFRLNVHPHMD